MGSRVGKTGVSPAEIQQLGSISRKPQDRNTATLLFGGSYLWRGELLEAPNAKTHEMASSFVEGMGDLTWHSSVVAALAEAYEELLSTGTGRVDILVERQLVIITVGNPSNKFRIADEVQEVEKVVTCQCAPKAVLLRYVGSVLQEE